MLDPGGVNPRITTENQDGDNTLMDDEYDEEQARIAKQQKNNEVGNNSPNTTDNQDENKRKQWMDAVRKYLPDGAFISSKHFPIHFIGEKKLLKGAKPSCILQLDYPVEKTPFET